MRNEVDSMKLLQKKKINCFLFRDLPFSKNEQSKNYFNMEEQGNQFTFIKLFN